MVNSTIHARIDTTEIKKAVNLANELIDKINKIQSMSEELKDIVGNIDFVITLDEPQADS